jgi:glutathione S-transferase
MKLYGYPGTRTNRVRWLLEEVGASYELVTVEVARGGHKAPEHLARHPHGAVPVLEDGDLRLIESCAMVLHIADEHADAGLAPAPGTPERGLYYQWVVYAAATLDEPIVKTYFHSHLLPPARRDPAIVERYAPACTTALELLEAALAGRSYLLGDFSAADVAVGYALNLAGEAGLVAGSSRLAAYLESLRDRPAFKRAYG